VHYEIAELGDMNAMSKKERREIGF
jgi:hypothetical protein